MTFLDIEKYLLSEVGCRLQISPVKGGNFDVALYNSQDYPERNCMVLPDSSWNEETVLEEVLGCFDKSAFYDSSKIVEGQSELNQQIGGLLLNGIEKHLIVVDKEVRDGLFESCISFYMNKENDKEKFFCDVGVSPTAIAAFKYHHNQDFPFEPVLLRGTSFTSLVDAYKNIKSMD